MCQGSPRVSLPTDFQGSWLETVFITCYTVFVGNFDQAISCLEHQITLAKEQTDKTGESDACCGLGGVYQQMGDYERAINFHKKDLQIAQVRAY